MRESRQATLNVFGFAIGYAVAGFLVRLLLIPTDLGGRSNALMLSQGDIGSYLIRALVFAFFAGIAGAIVAVIHNEFAKRG